MENQRKNQKETSYAQQLAMAMKSLKGSKFLMDTDPFKGNLPEKMPDRFNRK